MLWRMFCAQHNVPLETLPSSLSKELKRKWQQLKKSGDKAALESFQEQKLRQRDAWQFIYQQTVKVLGHEPKQHRVHVEMQGPGRGICAWLGCGSDPRPSIARATGNAGPGSRDLRRA